MRGWKDITKLADYPAMSLFFVCWHSRKWWPSIRGGTLQLALLRLEKVNWTDYFCIKSISYTNCQWKGKKQHKKQAKALQKPVFSCLSQNSWNEGSLKIEISKSRDPSKWKFPKWGIPQNGNFQNEGSLKQMANRWRWLQLCEKWFLVHYLTLHCKHWKFFYAILY